MEEIQSTVEERPSRVEDLEQILELKGLLSKKEKEVTLLMDELKWYKLELENKEETYNKIFSSHPGSYENISASYMPKKKEFKLRRSGKSVTTVRDILNSMGNNDGEKKGLFQPLNAKNMKIL